MVKGHFTLLLKETVIKNVLIVDDERVFLQCFSECVASSNQRMRVLTAEDGMKALKVLQSEHVDLVVTDLKMPVMNGYQLISYLKSHYPHISVIAMSASINPDTESRLRTLGVDRCIEKSVDLEDLVNLISIENV